MPRSGSFAPPKLATRSPPVSDNKQQQEQQRSPGKTTEIVQDDCIGTRFTYIDMDTKTIQLETSTRNLPKDRTSIEKLDEGRIATKLNEGGTLPPQQAAGIKSRRRDSQDSSSSASSISTSSSPSVSSSSTIPLWITDLNLTISDKKELYGDEMLSDKHICAAQKLLSKQFPGLRGLQDACLSQTAFATTGAAEAVQIHHVRGSHWVVSSSIGSRIRVYDTLYSTMSDDLKRHLTEIYNDFTENGKLRVEFPKVEKQRGFTDCGLFAIAIAFELCSSYAATKISCDLETTRFDQGKMRRHLIRCFEIGQMTPFPRRNCDANNNSFNSPAKIPLLNIQHQEPVNNFFGPELITCAL